MMDPKLFVLVRDFKAGKLQLVVYEYRLWNLKSADDVILDKGFNNYANDSY